MWYSPLKYESFFIKKTFSEQFRRRMVKLPIYCHGKIQIHEIKKKERNLLKFLTLLDTFFQNLT